MSGFRNRILGLEYVAPSDLRGHPMNWREHPTNQKSAILESLENIGVVGAVVAFRDSSSGKLTIIDGHLRADIFSKEDEKVPVLVVDLNDDEAKAVLMSFDPIASLAVRNDKMYEALCEDVAAKCENLRSLVSMMDVDVGEYIDEDEEAYKRGSDPNKTAIYEICPVYDEGYDAVIIVCATETEWSNIHTILSLGNRKDRRGSVGTTHVITYQEFAEKWKSKS